MEAIRDLYRIGHGPSSSHTMGPRLAAEQFRARTPGAVSYRATLFGSLAATGRGHLTDEAVRSALKPFIVEFIWKPADELPMHPNGMIFEALDANGAMLDRWQGYSIGGGAILAEGEYSNKTPVYKETSMQEILRLCTQ